MTTRNNEHSPAPWVVAASMLGIGGEHVEGVRDCDGMGIANCGNGEHGKANARLIAAAPEMLAALVECAAWFELDHHRERAVMAKDTEIGRRMIEAARAAIAKAVQS